MNKIKYLFQFLIIIFLFLIFKCIGIKFASFLSGKLFEIFGPYFRSKKITYSNIKKAFPNITEDHLKKIVNSMWNNYGRVFAEYVFIKKFRNEYFGQNIFIEGEEILKKIRDNNEKVVFISGHFSNFELMAMQIEKSGIKLAAIYRPLNNIFLNGIMESIRKKHICKNQIKKGIGGIRELLILNKRGFSTALMIDQRVTEGIKSNFFGQKAFTTTIPAQLIKKFQIPVVPIFIERFDGIKFKISIHSPINFPKNSSTQDITDQLNLLLEKMIIKKPENWIWSHNRWK